MRRILSSGLILLGTLMSFVATGSPASADDSDGTGGGGWQEPSVLPDGSQDSGSFGTADASRTSASLFVAPAGASRYVSVPPERILDTRRAFGAPGMVTAGQTLTLPVVGRAAVPAGATAVVLNLTITGAAEWGFVTAYPTGQGLPEASAINVERPGQTVANLVTVPLGPDGSVQLYSYGATHLIADVEGYFVPATTSAAGRMIPRPPQRILDTRITGTPVRAGGEIELDVVGLGGLAADTDSVAVKVTVTQATGGGYWTAYPAGSALPDVSTLNSDAGQTIANQAIVRLSGGRMRIYSERGGHLIVDLVGSFTGPTAPVSSDGLFVPVTPSRLLDTRQGLARPGPRRTFEVTVADRFGLPNAAMIGAVVVNATVAEANPGFVSVWPARNYRPNASSLNASSPGQTIASHVITPVSTGGFAVFLENGMQAIIDISGWFIGAPQATNVPVHIPLTGPNGPAESGGYNYLFGSDSTDFYTDISNPAADMAPVRWNPCRPIRYVVNLAGYPESYRLDIEEAIDRMSSSTGLTFTSVGDTTFMPTTGSPYAVDIGKALSGGTPYDLVIALSNESLTDALNGGVVGRAAPIWTLGTRQPRQYVHASLVIDVEDVMNRGVWSGFGVGQVLLHELGHVVGLGHVNDATQVMNPYISGAPTFAGGDLRGLWQVGAARGCV